MIGISWSESTILCQLFSPIRELVGSSQKVGSGESVNQMFCTFNIGAVLPKCKIQFWKLYQTSPVMNLSKVAMQVKEKSILQIFGEFSLISGQTDYIFL